MFGGMATATCQHCGAPEVAELVHCRYCENAYSREVLAHAIPCPRCRLACRWGQQKCARCQSWIVVSCVFCGALSPHNQAACLACREPFQGAMERKRAREQQVKHQENMQTFGTVGHVAAPFLGAAIGGATGAALWGHSHHGYGYHPGWSTEQNDWVDAAGDDAPPIAEDWSGSSSDYGSDDSGGGDFGGGGWDE